MRLRSLSLRGVTTFTRAEPVTVDLEELGAGLVAIAGPNGAGKSTLLEAVPAALWKTLPSRPGWYEHFHGRDAFVEVLFEEHGEVLREDLRARIQVDAERRTTEAYLFADGRSLTTGKAAEFETEVARRFGSIELFLASAFAAQTKAGNFLGLPKGERKGLLIELLGLGHLQQLAEAARERRGGAELEVARIRALAEASRAIAATVDERRSALAEARRTAGALAPQLERARAEETAAAAAVERARAEATRRQELERAVRTAEARRNALAAERPEDLRARARARHGAGLEAIEARRRKAGELLGQADQVEAAAADVLVLEDEEATLLEAQAAAARARDVAGAAEKVLLQARHRLESARRALEVERTGLRDQAAPVDAAPCGTSAEWSAPASPARDLAGACPLLAGARGALDRLRVLGLDPRLERDVESAEAGHARAQAALEAAQGQARPEQLVDVRRRLTDARRLAAIAPSIERARTELAGLEAERCRLDDALAEDLAAADQAEVRLASQLQAVERELADATGALAAAAQVDEGRARATAREASSRRQEVERELRLADQELAGLAVRLEEAERAGAAAADQDLAARAAVDEVADWQLLERALGRDGVQALEIDAAGPEVARITNELLEACYGPRFSLAFETLREKKSARGEFVEAFDVKVFDGGRDRPVEALSGGERVVVGEAIGLAIAIFNARKSGVRWETLFRDETAGALDPKNATAYTDMLRRALSLGGFHQVVFVAHQAEVVERADVVLEVAGGRVSLRNDRRPAA